MRNLFILLCLFSVVACPYECAVKQFALRVSAIEVREACSEGCCSNRKHGHNDEEAPATPTPQKDGLCCVCEGVALASSSSVDLDDLADSVDVAWLSFEFEPVSVVSISSKQDDCALPLLSRDSQSLRIALRSLLI